ncbi:MAG TPA: acetate/propionate family kinase [Puia sp.]|uniref:acetate/propionate family kinase n=1 Tax=Puia sp. TaxID=2045100 RepID=UPI0009298A34|nr:acetate/propionate family kinase [Puia sp.]MBN8852708.1 acetate/propionate family kinase [Sphingobacteriales bacterium]OJW55531.1 MAG: acetate kinase [Sphingobacteriales bacterium 50-39]HVU96833.1 acetate/propionate family kinase [Puia sp.]
MPGTTNILTINSGSSSIKFALYAAGEPPARLIRGKIDRIGLDDPTLTWTNSRTGDRQTYPAKASDIREAAFFLADWVAEQKGFDQVRAIGHRIVYGPGHSHAVFIDEALMNELHRNSVFDPDHLPGEIELIEIFRKRYPQLPQAACFDTSFHADMPRVAQLLPIPRRYDREGVRRYGFHGLSCAYILEELTRIAGAETANGRILLAHLGNGASITAIKNGRSIDTSMGFTPAGGIIMGTRPGDVDPCIVGHIISRDHLSTGQLNDLVNHQCGLLGVSEISPDMHDLLEKEGSDIRAVEAISLFCYQVKKWIGAFSAVLGGVGTLVFTGGIGENAAAIRWRICQGLEFLGIKVDEKRNAENASLISTTGSSVTIYVLPTDEEKMIATMVFRLLVAPDKKY